MSCLQLAVFLSVLASPLVVAQTASQVAGHWEGTIGLSLKQVKVAADFIQMTDGKWSGSVAFPELGVHAAALSMVVVSPPSLSFQSQEALCMFEGQMAPDGKSMEGGFVSGNLRTVPVPMKLRWVSAPREEQAPGSGGIPPSFEGNWEGALKIAHTWEGNDPPDGITHAVRVHLASGADGVATGSLSSAAAGNAPVPLSAITRQGTHLRFEVKVLAGVYTGELQANELVGQWSQFGSDPVNLTLKRAATR